MFIFSWNQSRRRFLLVLLAAFYYQFLLAAPPDTLTVHYYFRDTLCSNQSLFIVNQIFDQSHPNGTILLAGAAVDGSDSLVHVELVYREPSRITLEQNLCVGDTLRVNGKAYHANFYLGEETIEGGAANGCDSIIEVRLHVVTPPIQTVTDTLCPDAFRIVNGQRYDRDHPAGMTILPAAAFNGCDSTIIIDLTFKDLALSLGPDRRIVSGDTVCLRPALNFVPLQLTWTPVQPCPDTACASCIQPLVSASYRLTATDSSGCALSDDVTISVSKENRVYAPNVFNPAANEPNNRFFLTTDRGVRQLRRLLIADRWGETLFDVTNLQADQVEASWDGTWRGKPVLPGVYFFWTELERLDGSTFTQAGTVTVVR